VPGGWGHLALRFLDVVTAPSLADTERETVRRWLSTAEEEEAFFSQPPADQRHGYRAALQVAGAAPDRPDLVRAALLHDIGKRHAGLGAPGRAFASVAIRLRLPLQPRWALYRDHGLLAAAELAGAEAVVVDFARAHHGDRPSTITPAEWETLVAADDARLGR
jgi:hypothetical protein